MSKFKQLYQENDFPYRWKWECTKCTARFWISGLTNLEEVHTCKKHVINLRKDLNKEEQNHE